MTYLLLTLIQTFCFAQVHQGHYEITQGGKKVGEVFVPVRSHTATTYTETWVVGPDYIYPSSTNSGGFTIKSTGKSFSSEAEFLNSVRGLGGKLIRIDASEKPNR